MELIPMINGGLVKGELVVFAAKSGVGKSKMSESLTRNERLNLAVCYFGLYTIGMATNDCDKVDEDCAMDNAGVPFYYDQLNDRQRKVLDDMVAFKEKAQAMMMW
jgi:hypothetical protein